MKFRFSSGITLTSGQYEPTLKLHLFLGDASIKALLSIIRRQGA
ncbi:MAG TPA: hypothetical protein VFF41_07850 [Gallionella sp.]|nr:hypothetical protein [Gallionella sp.]